MKRDPHVFYATVLTGLLLLFCFRVGAQLVQAWSPVDFLPPFKSWESGAVPYWLLCVSQAIIIFICARVIWRLYCRKTVPSVRLGNVLLVIGGLYWGLMCIRLIIGLTVAPDDFWFGATLPTLFHLVLATFVLVCGRFHGQENKNISMSALRDAA